LEKVIRSAVANADQNSEIDIDLLVVRNVVADQGPTLKRWRARARGRATRILKRTSHITVILDEESSV
jgi:large subunit ribosomal protein L22